MGGKGHHNKLLRIITLPFRFLKKGKDMYVKSMMDVASKPRYGSSQNMMGSRNKSSKASSALPKSFSTSYAPSLSSTNFEGDDLKELIRANSTTYNSNDPTNKLRTEMDLYLKQVIKEQQVKKLKESLVMGTNNRLLSSQGVVPRSVSVGMGKIDEEKPFEEEEEEEEDSVQVKKKKEVMFPRSRSHAVSQTTAVF